MPRRGSSPVRRSSPSRSNLPARPAPSTPATYQQPKQPGMFAQMATTAAGFAVGSAVGHTVGAALTGGMSDGHNSEVQPVEQVNQQPSYGYSSHNQQNPCQNNLEELLRCTQNESDISLCTGFSEALKDCKRFYGLP